MKKHFSNSMFGHKSGTSKGSKAPPKDPYPLYSTRGYQELDELEAQKQAQRSQGINRSTEINVVVEDRNGPAP